MIHRKVNKLKLNLKYVNKSKYFNKLGKLQLAEVYGSIKWQQAKEYAAFAHSPLRTQLKTACLLYLPWFCFFTNKGEQLEVQCRSLKREFISKQSFLIQSDAGYFYLQKRQGKEFFLDHPLNVCSSAIMMVKFGQYIHYHISPNISITMVI